MGGVAPAVGLPALPESGVAPEPESESVIPDDMNNSSADHADAEDDQSVPDPPAAASLAAASLSLRAARASLLEYPELCHSLGG